MPSLPGGYFYWPLTEKWHCKSEIATDVKANIGNVPAEAPSRRKEIPSALAPSTFQKGFSPVSGILFSLFVLCILRLK